jgi:hypothetical protein
MITESDFVDIMFDDDQIIHIRKVADRRGLSNRALGYKSQKVNAKMSDKETDYIGVMGEAGYCVYMGIELSEIAGDMPGGDGGYDFVLSDGMTVDVKITTKRNYNLLRLPLKKGQRPNFYVLCWPKSDNEVTIIGAISASRFDMEKRRQGPGELVSWQSLKTMAEFQEFNDKRINHGRTA